jgi:hypothetical protein
MAANGVRGRVDDTARGTHARAKRLKTSPSGSGPLGRDRGSVSRGIERLLAAKPMVEWADGRKAVRLDVPSDEVCREHVEAIKAGELSLPRLAALHALLSGSKRSGEVLAVDGGSSALPHTTAALAMMGSKVVVRGRDSANRSRHMGQVLQYFGKRFEDGRIDYADITNPVDIAYWADLPDKAWELGVVECLGHGVRSGGYLVVQGNLKPGYDLEFDPERWDRIFSAVLTEGGRRRGLVLPTANIALDQVLQVFQRR